MSAINEVLVRDVVADVLSRLGQSQSGNGAPAPAPAACGCETKSKPSGGSIRSGRYGVFQDANEACAAAHGGFQQLRKGGVAARAKIVELVKTLAEANAEEWGRIELEETKIGRLDHKIEKLKIIKLVPGVEFLKTDCTSGDHGLTLTEYAPFGVIGAITPVTHSLPTLAGNVISMVAGGNTLVVNAHPGGARIAAEGVRRFNKAIYEATGLENLITIIEQPTLQSAAAIFEHRGVRLLCVTGGPAVARAALESRKRAIVAGPGNPPVVVDESACADNAARSIVKGAAYDNNLLCIGEK